MRFNGHVKIWNDDRGFGFIEPTQGGQEIFVHIKAFPAGTGRPVPNLQVTFEVELATDGKKRAKNVMLVRPARSGSRTTSRTSAPWGNASIIVLTGFTLALLLVTVVRGISAYLALGYMVMSVVCATAYWLDKTAAQNGQWRIPETTLLMLGMFGGWPGAIVAQQTLRHKTSKESFRVAFWATVVVNVGVFVVATTPLLRIVQF
ncbi:DUF1294 domain-containing protein [Rhodoferax ferrireducens]|uniref:DUF1294 domain-containing protein n=1 Tax=Rhodoferax ferrireducens TaxID=192843 RepID=UPI000E0CBFC8|nr:cold shock and DUF1294 domain-containing protein [Rhodoferax ferrireducens]